jgi:hypothetical protein
MPLLLQTKGEMPFDRAVTGRSKLFFDLVSRPNRGHFSSGVRFSFVIN